MKGFGCAVAKPFNFGFGANKSCEVVKVLIGFLDVAGRVDWFAFHGGCCVCTSMDSMDNMDKGGGDGRIRSFKSMVNGREEICR